MITGAVFIELKKAFDFVDHENASFLSQNTTESDEVVWTGSGTILPHQLKKCILEMTCLHVLYINDLPQCLENCSINIYADETVMYFTNLCTSEIARVVQDDLNGWKVSGLSLIRVKQKSMLFA